MKIKHLITLLILLFIIPFTIPADEPTIKIASFNIQIFGKTKANKPDVMYIITDIIQQYDLVAIQEIRDKSGTAIEKLMTSLNQNDDIYAIEISPRLGRSSSKEEYAFLYRMDSIEFIDSYTFDDDNDGNGINDIDDSNHDDDFEREPFIGFFKSKNSNFDFLIINNHIKPDDAEIEISMLPEVIENAIDVFDEPDVILLGDLNADGSYYTEEDLDSIFPDDGYESIISDAWDTTIAKSDNTYDRIILTDYMLEDFTSASGVHRFDLEYSFTDELTPKKVSDHYPVWAEFYVERDSEEWFFESIRIGIKIVK
jgi:deoxyribonuclease-1-like protein